MLVLSIFVMLARSALACLSRLLLPAVRGTLILFYPLYSGYNAVVVVSAKADVVAGACA